jgi:superfamily II DNA or RNA helicase/HKD family nuclease
VKLVDNQHDDNSLAGLLRQFLDSASRVFVQVAYLRESGAELLHEAIEGLLARAGGLRILVGGDFAQTEPQALRYFRELKGDTEIRLVSSSGIGGFHPKYYLFYAGDSASLVVGSSNFTAGGLRDNMELNLHVELPATHELIVGAQRIFDTLWQATPPLTDERMADYVRFWKQYHESAPGFIFRPAAEKEVNSMPDEIDPSLLQAGDVVQFNDQQGEVMSATKLGDRWNVRVAVQGVGPRSLLSPPATFTRVETPLSRARKLDLDSSAEFDLLSEATRLSLSYEHDRLVSLSNSRAKLEPFQVAAVHKMVSAWEQRFLLADDVGLGKTVEAGMVVKELKARHRADKVLIICPAGLALQWQREMAEKFDERFDILSSPDMRQWRSTRPADEPLSVKYPHAIVSLDTAKPRDDQNNAPDFTEAHWDVVIIDEAHKVAQHGVGQELISRYKLARDIAPSSDCLLLLSATPHDGDPFAFHSLLDLIDPLRFPDADKVRPDLLEPIMVRRGKLDIRKEDGTPLFPPRWVETTEVKFAPDELRLYNEVTAYVRDGYRTANEQKDTAVGFLMVLLQKRMVSSIAAIRRSLERRLIALQHPEAAILTPSELRELQDRQDDEEALTDARREQLQDKLEAARLRLSLPQHQAEIAQVQHLVELARGIKEVDSKAKELRKFVQGVLAKAPDEKVLIFTEYTDTLDFLRDTVLAGLGQVAQIYGQMNMEDRQAQEELFQRPDIHIMVATDAAGEGLNLQFCHLMVNYELPWNPNRIEQRIGRLHRYGQDHDVRVYNLQVANTREGIVLLRLLEKIKMIEKQLGGYAPNVLGISAPAESVDLNRLSDLIMNAIANDTAPEVTAGHVEEALEARRKMYDQIESDLFLALHRFDLGATDALIKRSCELTPSNADIEHFVGRYVTSHDGKIENTRQKHIVRVRTPRCLADNRYVLDEYSQLTFDKATAFRHKARELQFVAFGHPLLDAIIRDCRTRVPRLRGAVSAKVLPKDVLPAPSGVLFNYTSRFSDAQDKTLSEELMPVFVSFDGRVSVERVHRILAAEGQEVADAAANQKLNQLVTELEGLESLAKEAAAKAAQSSFERLQAERARQADACLTSLEHFQQGKRRRLKESISGFQLRLFDGEDMDIAIRRAQYELDRLDEDCERRRRQIEARRHAQANAPELLNVAFLLSAE